MLLGLLLKKKGSIKAGARVCNWRSCNPKFLRYFYQLSCCSRQSKKGDCRRLFFCFWVWWWSTLSTAELLLWILVAFHSQANFVFCFFKAATARICWLEQKFATDETLSESLQNHCRQRCLTAMLESGEERCTPAPLTKLHWGRGGWTHLLALWWLL